MMMRTHRKGEIVITDRMIERAVYWIIILLLLVLLVFVYLRSPTCSPETPAAANATATEAAAANAATNSTNATAAPAPGTTAPAVATCTDGVKNQDETDVDCGGTICHQCALGKSCLKDGDCSTDRCVNGVCASALSGQVVFSLGNVLYGVSNASGSAKITSMTVSITNGQAQPSNLQLQVFVQTADGVYYLNQLPADEDAGTYKPYATFDVSPIPAGQTRQDTYSFDGHYASSSYFYSATNHYTPGDDVIVVVKLVDQNTGSVLGTQQKKVLIS